MSFPALGAVVAIRPASCAEAIEVRPTYKMLKISPGENNEPVMWFVIMFKFNMLRPMT